MPDERSSFWNTAPGILTGVAALITALVGAAALIIGLLPDTPTQDGSSTGEPIPSAAEPGGQGGDSVYTVEMRVGDKLDVDTGLVGGSVRDSEVNWVGGWFLHGIRNAVIEEETDRAGCIDALEQRSDDYVPDSRFDDNIVCLETEEGAIAQVRPSTPDSSGRMTVDVTVWE